MSAHGSARGGLPENVRADLAQITTVISPENARATDQVMMALHSVDDDSCPVVRDIPYGPDERQQLDVFGDRAGPPRPVLVFVHGGNFVAGNKHKPGSPFYDNVGRWATTAGFVGVTINYRLAPDHQHPSGPEDLSAVVDWLQANVGCFGGDPTRIIMMGASAGAIHVATYLVSEQDAAARIAGAILVSGIYSFASLEADPVLTRYFGPPESVRTGSPLPRLAALEVPLLPVVAERDPLSHQTQFLQLCGAILAYRGALPSLLRLSGHNHFSTVLGLGGPEDALARGIVDFVGSLEPARSERTDRQVCAVEVEDA